MKKITILALTALCFSTFARADEGMWLPALITQRIDDMQAKGFRLTAEDVYSINQASLKDAVVLFGRGCTGELVSADGLLFTNHHCGYGCIQRHSSVEHDYLRDGFWAKDRSEELPNPGMSVSFLERMQEVTDIVLKGYVEGMSEAQRDSVVKANSEKLKKEALADGVGTRASVEALYYGNQYYLFIYREYGDIRLVGAPPSSIGKFGGDTDNWMWPRHTGDFSVFRVYADKNNNPATYSEDNVPYHPKKFFPICTKGVQEGDFTFIYGCPGSTQEYLMSEGVRYISEISDPLKIGLRTLRLGVQKKYMSSSQKTRIQYSSKNAGVSNAWKKWQGEAKGIARNNVVARKQKYEEGLSKWAAGTRYDGLLGKLAAVYAELEPFAYARDLYTESARTFELGAFAVNLEKVRASNPSAVEGNVRGFFKDYCADIDRESMIDVMKVFNEKAGMRPAWFDAKVAEHGSVEAYIEYIFANSSYVDAESAVKPKDKPEEDPAYEFQQKFEDWARAEVLPQYARLNARLSPLYREYMKAQMAYSTEKEFYPDANLTLRVAYGKVAGYEPYDGARYRPVSTLKGIMEKDNPDVFDYNIPQVLRDVYAEGGHEAQPVCFLATNHTTGGNSGSPVINADGQLIGINFDRVWEGTMSDIAFDPSFCRNISLDVRYLLFVIDRIGGASYLLDEMEIVK